MEIVSFKVIEKVMNFKNIFLSAFAKAKKDTAASAKTQWAQHISFVLSEEYGYEVNERTLRDYYNVYSQSEEEPITQPKPHLVEALCKYLGYDSYKHYNSQKQEMEGNKGAPIGKPKDKTILRALWVLAIIGVGWVSYTAIQPKNENDCMVWKNDHYELVDCSGERFEKKIDLETFKGMKQLIDLCRDDTFFLPNDEPVVWYDKHNNKLSFFTTPGIHPTNGRTLKPITQRIIDAYIETCD